MMCPERALLEVIQGFEKKGWEFDPLHLTIDQVWRGIPGFVMRDTIRFSPTEDLIVAVFAIQMFYPRNANIEKFITSVESSVTFNEMKVVRHNTNTVVASIVSETPEYFEKPQLLIHFDHLFGMIEIGHQFIFSFAHAIKVLQTQTKRDEGDGVLSEFCVALPSSRLQ